MEGSSKPARAAVLTGSSRVQRKQVLQPTSVDLNALVMGIVRCSPG